MMSKTETTDLQGCEQCGKQVPIEDAIPTADGCYLCAGCDQNWRALFDACQHQWKPRTNEWGESAAVCGRCSGTVALEDFPSLGLDAATVPAKEPANAR